MECSKRKRTIMTFFGGVSAKKNEFAAAGKKGKRRPTALHIVIVVRREASFTATRTHAYDIARPGVEGGMGLSSDAHHHLAHTSRLISGGLPS